MAYLDSIVDSIDNVLKGKLTAFPTGTYSGLVYQISRVREKKYEFLPAKVNDSGDAKWITFDDINELGIYHKIANSTYTQIKNQSYGDGYDTFQHNYDVDLFVMADRRKVNVTPDVLEAAISSNIPLTSTVENVEFINITPVSASHNSRSLFSQEFIGVNYFLKPEHIFFSIRYRVELRYRKGCISLCQCN